MTGARLLAALLACASSLALAQTASVVLRWSAVEGAQRYDLQIAKDPAFEQRVLEKSLPTPGFRWEKLPAEQFYWRVRSVDAEGRAGLWSAAQTIARANAPPSPLAPDDGAKLAWDGERPEVELRFESSPVFKAFIVEVAGDASFSGARTFETSAPSLALPLTQTGALRERVRGVDLEGRTSEPSPARQLRVTPGAPRTRPVAKPTWAPAAPLTLSWLPAGGAQKYEVELQGRGKPLARKTTAGTELTFTPPGPGPYRWRVVAVDAVGTRGDWTDWLTFELRLGPPELVTPADAQQLARAAAPSAHLRWKPVAGAESYRVEVVALDGRLVRGEQTRAVELPLGLELPPGTYRWTVHALDAGLQPSSSAPARTFVVHDAPLAPPQQASAGAAGGPAAPDAVERRWTAGAQLGWFTNFGSLTSPSLALVAAYRTPYARERLLVSARLAVHGGGRALPPLPVSQEVWQSSAQVVPLSVLGLYEHPLDGFLVHGGLGPTLSWVRVTLGPEVQMGPVLGAQAVAGGARAWGIGDVFAELSYLYAPFASDTLKVRAGGFTLSAGYRVRL